MKTIFRIARTELRTLFYSPIAWFLLIAYFVQSGMSYLPSLKMFAGMQEIGGDNLKQMDFLTDKIFGGDFGLFPSMMQKLYLFIPLLTMGLLSRETGSGTIKLLYSSPIRVREIVFGKFSAMLFFNLIVIALTSFFMISGMFHIKDADGGLLLSCALGMYLILCTYSAIGLFMSSLTTYPVVAAVCTFVMIGVLTYIGNVWQNIAFIRDITLFLSLQGRTQKMLAGLISTKDVLYFLVIIWIFVGITICKLRAGRESKPFFVKAARYLAVILSGLVIGYLSSRPALTAYYDATAQHTQTLTPNAQRIIKKLGDDPLEVTTYNNLLGRMAWSGFPQQQNRTLSIWEPYLRFKANISFPFVQYYDEPLDFSEPFSKLYQGRTVLEVAKDVAHAQDLDLAGVLTPEQMHSTMDLRPELNRYVMLLKWKDKKTFLRTFDDAQLFPSETEVSAAFKRLLPARLPKVGFVTGNLERNIGKAGAREYKTLTNMPQFRYSLVNQGFDTDTLNLDVQGIPAGLTTLVLADPKTELSAVVMSKVRQYIDKGGNLLIAGEPGKQGLLNPLLLQLGVQLMDGIIAQPGEQLTQDIALTQVTPAAAAFTSDLNRIVRDSFPVAMSGATGISYGNGGPFKVTPLLMTDAKRSWMKKGKLVLDSADAVFDAAGGDQRGAVPTAIGLSRTVNGMEQRIVVTGDADFMSNSDLNRWDVVTANFQFCTALFSWLDNGEFPIDTSRPDSIDNRTRVGMDKMFLLNMLYVWVLPAMMAAIGAILLIRRKRK